MFSFFFGGKLSREYLITNGYKSKEAALFRQPLLIDKTELIQ